jgi:hypothetical protein
MERCAVLRLANRISCLGIGLLLVIVMLPTGCKRSTTVADPEGAKDAVSKQHDGDELAFKGLNGEEVHSAGGKPVALPANFPADLAVYPGATVVMTVIDEKQMSITLNTPDAVKTILAFYKRHFKENGWKTINDNPKYSMLEAEKEGRTLMLIVTAKTKETSVQLILSK